MKKNKKTRLKGFKNIHFAPFVDGTFGTPVGLPGAKKLEAALNYELEQRESDDRIDEQSYIFKGGEGSVSLKSLTPEEYGVLFANSVNAELVAVRTTDIAPQGALLYERRFTESNHRRLYCIFNVKFAPSSLAAESCGDGTKEIDEELSFSVGEFDDDLVYITLDTDTEAEELLALINTWFTKVPDLKTLARELRKELKKN